MLVELHDADAIRYPNLALMKLSAWHRAQGDDVGWWSPLMSNADTVYSSKVFTWTPVDQYLPSDAVRGGIGYGMYQSLPDDVEHTCPDYAFYGLDYSMGFLTRGCPKKCKWCFVPRKEGGIKAHADIDEFLRHDSVVLMDNNVLASEHGIQQIEKMAGMGIRVDFNQGLDARLIDQGIARRLVALKWIRFIRIACDHKSQMKAVEKANIHIREAGYRGEIFCYVLVLDVDDAYERVEFLRGLKIDPFAQPFRDENNTLPPPEQRKFARWVNHKAIFKTVAWADYLRPALKQALEELE